MNEKVKLLLIAAMSRNRGIGKENALPWRLPKEFKYFVSMTKSVKNTDRKNAVILGRLTWESMHPKFRPLPDRVNIVITRNENYEVPEGVYLAKSLDHAVQICQSDALKDIIENIWVLGGQQIYSEAIKSPFCHRLYLTHINKDFDCDTFFPEFSCPGDFVEVSDADHVPKGIQEENGVEYEFKVYQRV